MEDFGEYDLRYFEDLGALRREFRLREQEHGLARLATGFAWPWISRKSDAADIVIGEERLRWNSTTKDWINSAGTTHEAGSIPTLQGYDLNYAGVIIGPDLRWNERSQRIAFDRSHYFDKKGRENNPKLGIIYSLLAHV
ncbi:DUF2075 domain-containing protein [Rathayibacter sp. AY1A5]|uniref:DUF2075 domain-containing protein n=1 Tax=Rathayibacter sp. AY1A5 TaxID=2080523 RepID=UPI0021574296|nr:DUF2075 domain-containing protein [Rathayibacter sp. AY1A5]